MPPYHLLQNWSQIALVALARVQLLAFSSSCVHVHRLNMAKRSKRMKWLSAVSNNDARQLQDTQSGNVRGSADKPTSHSSRPISSGSPRYAASVVVRIGANNTSSHLADHLCFALALSLSMAPLFEMSPCLMPGSWRQTIVPWHYLSIRKAHEQLTPAAKFLLLAKVFWVRVRPSRAIALGLVCSRPNWQASSSFPFVLVVTGRPNGLGDRK